MSSVTAVEAASGCAVKQWLNLHEESLHEKRPTHHTLKHQHNSGTLTRMHMLTN